MASSVHLSVWPVVPRFLISIVVSAEYLLSTKVCSCKSFELLAGGEYED